MSKIIFNRDFFYIGKGDNLKSLTSNTGKIVDFVQKFGSLVSFLYYLILV